VLLEFSSARPPGPEPAIDRPWHRSAGPGIAVLAAGAVAIIAGDGADVLVSLLGAVLAMTGGGMLGTRFARRRRSPGAKPAREPRQWTITDDDLRSGNRRGSVRWAWGWVGRVVDRPDVYLLYHDDAPHGFPFDIPRDSLTADQDGELRAFLIGRGLLPAG
jgi:hypothetical protein